MSRPSVAQAASRLCFGLAVIGLLFALWGGCQWYQAGTQADEALPVLGALTEYHRDMRVVGAQITLIIGAGVMITAGSVAWFARGKAKRAANHEP
ncbi:MAG: hypothetical protein C4524_06600 [Candidatus Zixiibacteriota bacterium]|nr:MAG: hypothetical protein C4524_06600 [candidate division Zixibacteria bacterium]